MGYRLLCILLLAWLRLAPCEARIGAMASCAAVPGYDFYAYVSVSPILVLARKKGLSLSTNNATNNKSDAKTVHLFQKAIIASLATACDATAQHPDHDPKPYGCNAFDTAGNLMVIPWPLILIKINTSNASICSCDGIYIASARNAFGLLNEGNETRESLAGKDLEGQKKHHKTYTSRELITSLVQSSVNGYVANSSRPFSYISNIRNQGACGTCVSFAFTALAEAAMAYALGNKTNTWDLSEQWLFFCHPQLDPKYTFPDCVGWTAGSALRVLQLYGITREGCMPFVGGQTCKNYCQTNMVYTHRRVFVPYVLTCVSDAKDFIRSGGAIASYMQACADFLNANRTWPGKPYVWNLQGACASHAVLVIGFNDDEGYWQIKNSWGTYWGEFGYLRVSYRAGVNLMCETCTNNMIGMRYQSVPPSYNVSAVIAIRGVTKTPPLDPVVKSVFARNPSPVLRSGP